MDQWINGMFRRRLEILHKFNYLLADRFAAAYSGTRPQKLSKSLLTILWVRRASSAQITRLRRRPPLRQVVVFQLPAFISGKNRWNTVKEPPLVTNSVAFPAMVSLCPRLNWSSTAVHAGYFLHIDPAHRR
jgi:hypothetical protein